VFIDGGAALSGIYQRFDPPDPGNRFDFVIGSRTADRELGSLKPPADLRTPTGRLVLRVRYGVISRYVSFFVRVARGAVFTAVREDTYRLELECRCCGPRRPHLGNSRRSRMRQGVVSKVSWYFQRTYSRTFRIAATFFESLLPCDRPLDWPSGIIDGCGNLQENDI